jgi:hypothetical protein
VIAHRRAGRFAIIAMVARPSSFLPRVVAERARPVVDGIRIQMAAARVRRSVPASSHNRQSASARVIQAVANTCRRVASTIVRRRHARRSVLQSAVVQKERAYRWVNLRVAVQTARVHRSAIPAVVLRTARAHQSAILAVVLPTARALQSAHPLVVA